MDIKTLFSFQGRVGRGTFWKIGLINLAILAVLFGIASAAENGFFVFLAVVVYLVLAVIGIATSVKRWHDRNKSGAWYFVTFVPLVGPIWALIENGFLAGTDGDNQYGAPDSGSPFVSESLPYDATAVPSQSSEWGR
jgi:uncharacterized membrane protein YhaH (DUF805 family)